MNKCGQDATMMFCSTDEPIDVLGWSPAKGNQAFHSLGIVEFVKDQSRRIKL